MGITRRELLARGAKGATAVAAVAVLPKTISREAEPAPVEPLIEPVEMSCMGYARQAVTTGAPAFVWSGNMNASGLHLRNVPLVITEGASGTIRNLTIEYDGDGGAIKVRQ